MTAIRVPADATVLATVDKVIAQRPPIRELLMTIKLVNRETRSLWFAIPARAQTHGLETMGVFTASAFSVGAKNTMIITCEGSAASHLVLVSAETSISLYDVPMSFYDSDLGDFVEIEALVGTAVMVDAQPIDRWIGIDRMSSAETSASYRDGVRPIARRETKGWAEVPLTMDVCRRVALRLELDVDE